MSGRGGLTSLAVSCAAVFTCLLISGSRGECVDLSTTPQFQDAVDSRADIVTFFQIDICFIKKADMDRLSNASRLFISESSVTEVGANAFAGMTRLRQLNLSNNKLTSLHADAFAGLPQLLLLSLSSNRLGRLDANLFTRLPRLEFLFLNLNSLTTLDVTIFDAQTSPLKGFSLADNILQCTDISLATCTCREGYDFLRTNQTVSCLSAAGSTTVPGTTTSTAGLTANTPTVTARTTSTSSAVLTTTAGVTTLGPTTAVGSTSDATTAAAPASPTTAASASQSTNATAVVATTDAPSSTPASVTTTLVQSGDVKASQLGVRLAAGIAGGLVLLAVLLFGVLFWKKRRAATGRGSLRSSWQLREPKVEPQAMQHEYQVPGDGYERVDSGGLYQNPVYGRGEAVVDPAQHHKAASCFDGMRDNPVYGRGQEGAIAPAQPSAYPSVASLPRNPVYGHGRAGAADSPARRPLPQGGAQLGEYAEPQRGERQASASWGLQDNPAYVGATSLSGSSRI